MTFDPSKPVQTPLQALRKASETAELRCLQGEEAADEIERLREENDRLSRQVSDLALFKMQALGQEYDNG